MVYISLTKGNSGYGGRSPDEKYNDDTREDGVSYRESLGGHIPCTMGSCPLTLEMYWGE